MPTGPEAGEEEEEGDDDVDSSSSEAVFFCTRVLFLACPEGPARLFFFTPVDSGLAVPTPAAGGRAGRAPITVSTVSLPRRRLDLRAGIPQTPCFFFFKVEGGPSAPLV